MKFMHLADLHLGKSVNEFSMIEDQRYILEQLIEIIKANSVDAVLIAGDIYDRSIPSEEAVGLLDDFLNRIYSLGKYVFVVSGNHDSEERLHFGSRLFQANHVYIVGKYEGEVESVELEDVHGKIHIWMLPYVKASKVAHFFPEQDIKTYDSAVRMALSQCRINTAERNIIIAHQFVTGRGGEVELAGSEMASLSVGNIEKIACDCFDDFDYVALGHIHSSQAVGRETCRYAGSPLKYSLHTREIHGEKAVPIITLREKGDIQVEQIFLKPLREVRRIKGELKYLLENAIDTQDYIYATLTDEQVRFDAMARLQEVYPNIMRMDYDNTSTRRVHSETGQWETEGKSFQELICGFYEWMNGRKPSEQEWELLENVAKEAGVLE